jgi:2-polyprenyl-3-methyl-5-hydroxy-6-metoxy-1,4-benzoquinol methylase
MDLLEDGLRDPINHWYYQHKFWFVKKAIKNKFEGGRSLVDIGAGSALFTKELLRLGLISNAVAVDTGYSADLRDSEFNLEYKQTSDFENFSIYLMTDVLEHIEDDLSFLSQIVNKAEKGAEFIITVPAHQFLWSEHDEYLRHFRRYSKRQLINLAESSGMQVLQSRYTYSTVLPIAFIKRKFFKKSENESQLRENNALTQLVLKTALYPDKFISRIPFGVSLYLKGVKNG